MKYILFLLISLSFLIGNTQNNSLNGVWQGLIFKDGLADANAAIFYASFEIQNGNLVGKTREETFKTDNFAIQKIQGKALPNAISFQQKVIELKNSSSSSTWCAIDATLTYNDSTGYLSGNYTSHTCRNTTGRIVLYRSDVPFASDKKQSLTHSWHDIFLEDLKAGRKAPEIRNLERKNFKFQTIYFDHDKTEIKPEYFAYLNKMIQVVNGHSDLRIKVTGNTDAVGTDAYNEDLSARRAKAIRDYFVRNGLSEKRLEIDFKGEKNPVGNNNTTEGKRKNRRVEFEFI